MTKESEQCVFKDKELSERGTFFTSSLWSVHTFLFFNCISLFKVYVINKYSFQLEPLIASFEIVDESKETISNVCSETTEPNKSIHFVSSPKQVDKEEKTYPTLPENRTNIKTKPYKRKKYKVSKMMDAVKYLSTENQSCPRVTFLDFAGQSMYYAFHQIYFSPKTCYILVVDMTKNPDDKVTETDDECCSLFKSWKYKGMKTF